MKTRMLLAGAAGVAIAVALALSATAKNNTVPLAGTRVDNFMLVDQQGVGQELYYFKHNPAVVIVTAEPGDPASAKALAAVEALRAPYEKQGVAFFGMNSTPVGRNAPLGSLVKAQTIPVLTDDLQLVGRSLGVTTTGEVFVIDPKTWKVAYHGPVADSSDKQ